MKDTPITTKITSVTARKTAVSHNPLPINTIHIQIQRQITRKTMLNQNSRRINMTKRINMTNDELENQYKKCLTTRSA